MRQWRCIYALPWKRSMLRMAYFEPYLPRTDPRNPITSAVFFWLAALLEKGTSIRIHLMTLLGAVGTRR